MKLAGYTEAEQTRIKAIACELLEGMVASGEVECSDEGIRAAMPAAFATARAAFDAASEFLCG